MIRRSRLVLSLSVLAAMAAHGAGLWVSGPLARIEIEGGAGAVEAMLGWSFADMVAGATQPVSDSTVTPNRQSDEVVNPSQPGDALRPETPEAAPTPERRETEREAETAQATPSDAAEPADTVDIARASEPEATARATQPARTAPGPGAAGDRCEAAVRGGTVDFGASISRATISPRRSAPGMQGSCAPCRWSPRRPSCSARGSWGFPARMAGGSSWNACRTAPTAPTACSACITPPPTSPILRGGISC
ncbi:MAG: hypothetical protein U5K36_04245 [Roseovarius sp.]|nr:hypothetical protein [Roseovarius sp.]